MTNKLELAQNRFLDGIGRMSNAFGLNKFVAQLYALLYLQGEPLSLDEIAEALGVTKGNVSINIRELEKWGAVRHVWVKGSRKDYYEADADVKKVFLNKVKSAVQRRTTEMSDLLEEFDRILDSNDGELSEEEAKRMSVYSEKLKKIRQMKDTIISTVELFSKLI